MEKSHEIKYLEKVVSNIIGRDKKLIDYNTKQLTAAGENYGSLMLAVDLIVEDKNDPKKEEIISLVSKLPPTNEWIRRMFNTPVTFKKEKAFYDTIVPTLQEFQREEGVEKVIDFFPKYYGSRLNLNDSDEVDENAIILLENLKMSGFSTIDRMVGFDLVTTQLILKDLAAFHAVPIALKLKKPHVFQIKLLPYLKKALLFKLQDKTVTLINNNLLETIEKNDECKQYTANVRAVLENSKECMNAPITCREPFATICHCDYWVNNTMIKYENGKPIKNVMVDFQIPEYGSPGNDIVFFLYSSVKKDVLIDNYDDLIKLYHKTFIKTLKDLHCDVSSFSYDALLEELKICANKTQFLHTIMMYKPIFLTKEGIKDLSETTEEDMISMEGLDDTYYDRVWNLVTGFAEKKWI